MAGRDVCECMIGLWRNKGEKGQKYLFHISENLWTESSCLPVSSLSAKLHV